MDITAIEVRNLQKRYKEITAVSGIDLTVKRGEIFGLVGADGAGKDDYYQDVMHVDPSFSRRS